MKRNKVSITNPDELEKNLQYTSPITWIILSVAVALIIGVLVWSSLFKFKDKITGKANIKSGEVTLVMDSKAKTRLKPGQKIYINELEGEILALENNKPVISYFPLKDGEYVYSVYIEVRPIEYLIK